MQTYVSGGQCVASDGWAAETSCPRPRGSQDWCPEPPSSHRDPPPWTELGLEGVCVCVCVCVCVTLIMG